MGSTVTRLVRAYPLTTYVVLAYLFSIVLGLGLFLSLMFGLIALFGPAAAAFIVARLTRGRAGVAELRAVTTRWRVHPAWYVAAIGLPMAGFGIGHLIFVLSGNAGLTVPGKVEPILLLLFFLVIGEEIGWRGFLLRGLLRRYSPLVATLIVGVVWALWHAPLYFIPGMPSFGGPFLAFAGWVVASSFLLTWLWLGTRSAWLATLMHGSANLGASLLFPSPDGQILFLYGAAGTALVAVPLVLMRWRRWTADAAPDPDLQPATAAGGI